jgi:hypothetical protein
MDHNWLILLHEAIGGERKSEMQRRLFALDASLDPGKRWSSIDRSRAELDPRPAARIEPVGSYVDPLGSIFPEKYGGRWIAGFAQVGNTELMVIVQQRYADAVGQPTSLAKSFVRWGWGSLMLACILTGLRRLVSPFIDAFRECARPRRNGGQKPLIGNLPMPRPGSAFSNCGRLFRLAGGLHARGRLPR